MQLTLVIATHQVVRHLAQHVPTDLAGVEHPQNEPDRLRHSNLLEERRALLPAELLGIVEPRGDVVAIRMPERGGVRHRSEDRTPTRLVYAEYDALALAVGGGAARWYVGEEERAGEEERTRGRLQSD